MSALSRMAKFPAAALQDHTNPSMRQDAATIRIVRAYERNLLEAQYLHLSARTVYCLLQEVCRLSRWGYWLNSDAKKKVSHIASILLDRAKQYAEVADNQAAADIAIAVINYVSRQECHVKRAGAAIDAVIQEAFAITALLGRSGARTAAPTFYCVRYPEHAAINALVVEDAPAPVEGCTPPVRMVANACWQSAPVGSPASGRAKAPC